jgi:hypothetical protein
LGAYGHCFPWALGSIWSILTDEQAGRLTAEIVRRVGPDPKVPSGVMPNGVLDFSRRKQGAGAYRNSYIDSRSKLVGNPCCPSSENGGYPGFRGWTCGFHSGPETGDAGQAAAERCAMGLGAILVEQVTPAKL